MLYKISPKDVKYLTMRSKEDEDAEKNINKDKLDGTD